MTRRFIALAALFALLGLPSLAVADTPDTATAEILVVDTAEAPVAPLVSANLALDLAGFDSIGKTARFCVNGKTCASNEDCGWPEGYCSQVSNCCVCF